MRRSSLRRRWAPAALAAALLGAPAAASPGAPTRADSALERLARSLGDADGTARSDFAAIALSEMLVDYERELERLSDPGEVSRRERAKQARWGRALRAFLDEIRLAVDALDGGAEVEILHASPAPLQLLIGERLVSLDSPRIDDPGALERRILAAYCAGFGCAPEVLDPRPPPPPVQAGGWSFRDGWGSTFETPNGLGFMFRDVSDRARKERVCRRVGEELARLANALADARRRGYRVAFRALRVEAPGRGDDHRVVLSPRGDSVRMFLPSLAGAPDVVAIAGDWLEARAEGRAARQLFPRSDLLLSALLEAPPARP